MIVRPVNVKHEPVLKRLQVILPKRELKSASKEGRPRQALESALVVEGGLLIWAHEMSTSRMRAWPLCPPFMPAFLQVRFLLTLHRTDMIIPEERPSAWSSSTPSGLTCWKMRTNAYGGVVIAQSGSFGRNQVDTAIYQQQLAGSDPRQRWAEPLWFFLYLNLKFTRHDGECLPSLRGWEKRTASKGQDYTASFRPA